MLQSLTTIFIVFYLILNMVLLIIIKTYLAENIKPNFITITICVVLGYLTVVNFPEIPKDCDVMFDMGLFVILAGLPLCLSGVILTRLFADFAVGSGDFDPDADNGYISDVKMPLDNLLASESNDKAIEFLKNLQLKGRYKRDYRVVLELATIQMTITKNYDEALKEYNKVLKMTHRQGIVSFCLYKIADIYAMNPETQKEAKLYLTKLARQFPDNEYGKNAEFRLKVMEMGGLNDNVFAQQVKEMEANPADNEQLFKNDTPRGLITRAPLHKSKSGDEPEPKEEQKLSLSDTSAGDAYQKLLKQSIEKSKVQTKETITTTGLGGAIRRSTLKNSNIRGSAVISPFASRQERFKANIANLAKTNRPTDNSGSK